MANINTIPCGQFFPGKVPSPPPDALVPDGGSVDPPDRAERPEENDCKDLIFPDPVGGDGGQTGLGFAEPSIDFSLPGADPRDRPKSSHGDFLQHLPKDLIIDCDNVSYPGDYRENIVITDPIDLENPPPGVFPSPGDPPPPAPEPIIAADTIDIEYITNTLTVTWRTNIPTNSNSVFVFDIASEFPIFLTGNLQNPTNFTATNGITHTISIEGLSPDVKYAIFIESKVEVTSDPEDPTVAENVGPILFTTTPGDANPPDDPPDDPPEGEQSFPLMLSVRDPRFSFYKKKRDKFVPSRSFMGEKIFSPLRHRSIDSVLSQFAINFGAHTQFIGDITPRNLAASLRNDLKSILFNIKANERVTLDRTFWYDTFIQLLASDNIDRYEIDYITKELPKYTTFDTNPAILRRPLKIKKSGFGVSNNTLRENRSVGTVTFKKADRPNSTRGVYKALSSKVTVDWRQIQNSQYRERMKLWYFVPEDIDKRVSVTLTDTSAHFNATVTNWNTFEFTTSAGGTETISVNDWQAGNYTASTGETLQYELSNNLDKSFTIKNHFRRDIFYDLKQDVGLKLTVESPSGTSASSLEYDFGVGQKLQTFYLYVPNPSSIQELESNNEYIKKSRVEYTRIVARATYEDLVKTKPFPWKMLKIDHEDPIFAHLDTSNSTVYLELSDFTLGDLDTEVNFVRNIPYGLVISPTNRTRFNPYYGLSKLTDWNTREMHFSISPDWRYYNTGLDYHYLAETNVDQDILGNKNNQAVEYEMSADIEIFTETYIEDSEPVPRRKSGFRRLIEVIQEIDTTFQNDGVITWYDVLSRLTPREFYTYKYGVAPEMVDKVRRGERTGVRLSNRRFGGNLRAKTNLGSVRSGQTDDTIIYMTDELF